jgi:hypothetical protein
MPVMLADGRRRYPAILGYDFNIDTIAGLPALAVYRLFPVVEPGQEPRDGGMSWRMPDDLVRVTLVGRETCRCGDRISRLDRA